MAAAGLAQRIEAVNDYMTSCQLVMTRDGLATSAAAQVDHLRKCLSSSTCSLPVASAAMQKLSSCTWLSRNEVEELSALIKVSEDTSTVVSEEATCKHKNQSNVDFTSYLTQKDWSSLREAQSPTAKIQILASRCVAIGMRWPSEAAAKSIVAVAVASGSGIAETSADDRLGMVHHLKHFLRNGRRTKTAVSSEHLLSFPPIDVFLRDHSKVYDADDMPAACPLTESSLSDAAAAVPVRRTNKSLSAGQMTPARSSRGDPALAMLSQLMQQLMPRGQAPSSIIQMCTPPPKRSRQEEFQLSLPPYDESTEKHDAIDEAEQLAAPLRVDASSKKRSIEDIATRVEAAAAAAKVARAGKKDAAAGAASAAAAARGRKPLEESPAGKPRAAAAGKNRPLVETPTPKAGAKPCMPAIGKPAQPIVHRGCKIYTSVSDKCWRVLPIGSRIDKRFKWGTSPASSWKLLLAHCDGCGK